VSRLAALVAFAEQLGADELAVLENVAEGLLRGRGVYGELDLARDQRDFEAETLAEVRDGLAYLGAALVRRARAR